MKRSVSSLLLALVLMVASTSAASAQPASAPPEKPREPATGLLLQGQLALNLTVSGGYSYYVGPFNLMPMFRIGWQFKRWALAADINYSSFSIGDDGSSGGMHLISIGPNVQPTLWRSRKKDVQLTLVAGFGVGTVVMTDDSGPDETAVLGHLVLGLGTHYFPSRHFGFGMETGIRVQFVRLGSGSDPLLTVAVLYVAISMEAIIGK